MGQSNCSTFCCALFYVHSSFVNILMRKSELVALLSLSSWCLVIVVWLFLAVSWVGLQCVIVVFPDHTHLLFAFMYMSLLVYAQMPNSLFCLTVFEKVKFEIIQ